MKYLIAILLFLSPLSAFAAIARDNTPVAHNAGTASATTASYTTTGPNEDVFIWAECGGSSNTVTATWDGVSATEIGHAAATWAGAGTTDWFFYLVGGNIGTLNATATVSAGSCTGFTVIVWGYTGAGAVENPTFTNGSGASFSASVTTSVSGEWLVGADNCQNSCTAGSGTSLFGGTTIASDSNGAVSVGSNALNWNSSPSGSWTAGAIGVQPAAAAATAAASIVGLIKAFWLW